MTDVVTRFAPSPTGSLHIGGVRTALFNWLFARSQKGKFLLRIEDTDRARSTKESEEEIIESMDWLGMKSDAPPVYQSQRNNIYQKYVDELLESGKAYRCTCSQERLDQLRETCMQNKTKPKYDGKCRSAKIQADCGVPFVIRIKAPESGSIAFEDTLRGRVSFPAEELDDFIIVRSDGGVIYNFVVAIDDHEMGLTNVIRGNDHISNTPKQIMVYQALGFPLPKFTHLSMILNEKKQKLSKRDGVSSVLEYKKAGYLPAAVMNYLARLGWSSGDQEIFSVEELCDAFDISSLNKADAVFNQEKFLWVNAQHIKRETPERLFAYLREWLEANGQDTALLEEKKAAILSSLPLFVEKAKVLGDIYEGMSFFLFDEVKYDEEAVSKALTDEGKGVLRKIVPALEGLQELSHDGIEGTIKGFLEAEGLKFKHIGLPLRVALTGGSGGPGIYDIIAILGREKSVRRIKAAAEL